MAHKFYFKALDKSLRDIMKTNSNEPKFFGEKFVVFGGDFRQILSIIPRGSRSDIVHATANASYQWDSCDVLTLTKNMWILQDIDNSSNSELQKFSQWILNVGEGKFSYNNDGYDSINIPSKLLIFVFTYPIHAIVDNTYSCLEI